MALNKKDFPNKIKTNLYANKEYNIFYYDFTINSKRYRGIINYSDKKAWNKRDRITKAESDLIDIRDVKSNCYVDDNISVDELLKKHFFTQKDTSWKKTKVNFYNRYIKKHIGKKKVVDIRQFHIKELIKFQEDLGLSAKTTKQTISVLNPAFKEAITNRLILHNPCDGIIIKIPKTKKIVTNATERLTEIYKAIIEVFRDDPFYQAMYLFALQGRRKGEILNLKWEDVSFQNNYYILRNTKNGETQKMYLPNRIKELLVKFRDTSGIYVFTSFVTGGKLANIKNSVNKLKAVLGDEFGIHYLRNVITSAMAEQGIESIYQSGALGHSDLTTINKYSTLNYLKGSQIASDIIDDIVNK